MVSTLIARRWVRPQTQWRLWRKAQISGLVPDCCCSMFCCALLCVHSSFTIILMVKIESFHGCFALFVFLVSRYCCVALLHDAPCLFAVCGSGISWSYSPTIFAAKASRLRHNTDDDCNRDIREKTYNSLVIVLPTLEYAPSVWDPNTSADVNRLEHMHRQLRHTIVSRQHHKGVGLGLVVCCKKSE